MKNPSVEKHVIACLLKASAVISLILLFSACGGDSSSNSGTSSGTAASADIHSEENDPSSYTSEEIVPIKNKTITGFAQKGPFKSGSTVDIFELELDGKTFAQTGKSFMGKVSNDSGAFKILNVSLKSQYALLRVTGNFKSEINGESVHATLSAVTDLSKRENVNVNILTHLEYDRVLYLLGKGMNFTAAKKQAEREVLAAFGIEGKFKNYEDLDVFGDSDADAALVAISKLVLAGKKDSSNRDEEDLSRLLTEIATDIEEDGEWNDYSGTIEKGKDEHSTTQFNKESIAGRVKESSCRCSIGESCYNDSKVEKFICQFYNTWREYSGADRYCVSDINQSFFRNKSKKWNDFYFCKDGVWYTASLDDANTYSWSAGKDGEIRKGEFCKEGEECSTGSCNIYAAEGTSGWQNTCIDIYYKYDGEKGEWRRATSVELDIYEWSAGKDGEIKKGDQSAIYYKYDEKKGEWLEASGMDRHLRACTMKHDGEIEKISDDLYLCRDGNWNLVGNDGEIKDENKYYDEELEQWIGLPEEFALQIINDIGFGCTKKKEGVCVPIGYTIVGDNATICADSICDGSYMTRCKNSEWNLYTVYSDCEPEYSTWPAGKDGELRKSEKSKSYFKYDAKDGWTPLSLAEADVYNLPCSKDGSVVRGLLNLHEYVCDSDTFRVANAADSLYDFACVSYTDGKKAENMECRNGVFYGSLKDDRDGKVYKTVLIGSQVWMAENLNFEYRIYNGGTDDSVSYGNYCNTDSCETNGRYYTWAAAMDSAGVYSPNGMGCGGDKTCSPTSPVRGICPKGWHLPDATEWDADASDWDVGEWEFLYRTIGESPYAMQAKGYEKWSGATDLYGFSVLPVGYYDNGRFDYVGSCAFFWSSTEYGRNDAFSWYLDENTALLSDRGENKGYGFSVRCVKDEP